MRKGNANNCQFATIRLTLTFKVTSHLTGEGKGRRRGSARAAQVQTRRAVGRSPEADGSGSEDGNNRTGAAAAAAEGGGVK